VLVFSVTRVIFIPQGELVAFSALSMAALGTGRTPGTLGLLAGLALASLVVELWRWRRGVTVAWLPVLVWSVLLPLLAALLVLVVRPRSPVLQAVTVLTLIAPLGPLLYRLIYRPMAHASVLVLLIASVALHGVLVGLGLIFFGAEGSSIPAFWNAQWTWGGITVNGQSLVVVGVTLALVAALALFFGLTIPGKALRATAMNRVGAQLMGIPAGLAGDLSFALAGLIGAVAGLLVGPLTTIYYDTGFLIGLKGFVAAIIGALASYPLALAGALIVGLLESFSSFWASAFKEVLVFALIIPVLWWRSLRSRQVVEDEEA
jgi:branched-chain amino acid transport system permease protein